MTDLAPQLGGVQVQLDKLTGDEPMLSGRSDLARMGKVQEAFLDWMREQWAKPDIDDISLLEAWRWVHERSGNAERSSRVKRTSRKAERYYQYTNAYLARLLHSFMRRGLILVIKKEDGYSFIRARDGGGTD